MHARLVTITGTDVNAVVRYLEDKVAPAVSQHRGFRQLAASGDRSRGLISIISVWDSMADLEASESAVAKLREEGIDQYGGQATVAVFEQLALGVGARGPEPGCVLRLVSFRADPGRFDDHTAWFNRDVLPAIVAAPGFRAARLLGDRATGEGRVGTVYADRASMEADDDARARRMASAGDRGIELGELDVLEILFGMNAP